MVDLYLADSNSWGVFHRNYQKTTREAPSDHPDDGSHVGQRAHKMAPRVLPGCHRP